MQRIKFFTVSTLCAIAIMFSCLFLSGCEQGGKKVAFFIYDGSDTFIGELMISIADSMPEGMSYETRDAGNSQMVQNQQIIELIKEDYDLFVINAVDRLACSSIVEKCSNEGIPIIFFNREPLADAIVEDDVFYVGAAADSLGERQADMVGALFHEDFQRYDNNGDGIIQLVVLKGEQGHQDAEKRTEKSIARLKAMGLPVETLSIEAANWNRQSAYEVMKQLYSQYGENIDLIFSNNDDMALGAIDYLTDAGIFKKSSHGYDQPMIIAGVDGTAVGLEAIDDGLLYGTVNNDAKKQADAIITLAESILNGGDMEEYPYEVTNGHYIYIDGEIITKENLSDYTAMFN